MRTRGSEREYADGNGSSERDDVAGEVELAREYVKSQNDVSFCLYGVASDEITATERVLMDKLATVFSSESVFETKCDRIARAVGKH